MQISMPRALVVGLLLVLGSIAAVVYSANFLAQVGRESILRSHAEATADQWVAYIQEVVPELSEIASGTEPSSRALMYLTHGIDTSSVMSYRLYGRDGELHAIGGAVIDDKDWLKHSKAGVAVVLKSGLPLLEMDIMHPDEGQKTSQPAHHLATAPPADRTRPMTDHSAHAGMEHSSASNHGGDQAHVVAPALPIDPSASITAYFHPIFSGEHLAGVLQIELDHGVIAKSFASTFRDLSVGLTLILGFAVAPPLGFAWLKSVQRGRAEQAARHLAFHDPLTHLPNRRYVREEIDRRLEESLSNGERMALLSLDLDGFKLINDAFGHAVGDDLLRQAARRMTSLLEPGDMLARLGGDEFLILPKLGTSPDVVQNLAEQVVQSLGKPFAIADQETSSGVSIGIVFADDTRRDADRLLSAGDVALYQAKMQGRRRAVLFEPCMEEQLRQRREVENDLRLAVAREELVLHYQPQFDVRTLSLIGFEALVRWQHPTRGQLPPSEFIQIAEDLKLINTMSLWIMKQACHDAMSWSRPLTVAVNISAIEFEGANIVATIAEALDATGLPPERLEIEITETVLMTNTDAVIDTLNQIRTLGVSVAMDDFGTGYSSLGYLCKFPFDKLKIDRSFLTPSDRPEQSKRVIEAIITLGRSLDLNVVAEGVEHAHQLAMLDSLACNEAQGFHLGRPMIADKARDLVATQQDQQTAADTDEGWKGFSQLAEDAQPPAQLETY